MEKSQNIMKLIAGYDDISLNAINNVFDFIVEPLRYIFSNSLVQRIFRKK